ncbi:MAG TPA: glycosyltransferase, partial [Thermohalobaculum sp.]|nr:glycosyltransferase [Thermohalobaculum sp.]
TGHAADIALPGHVDNPFAFMRRSAVFALSSRYEGLPGVLIQALACGCPAVATDCPSGPREILRGGTLGPLVPVGDPRALADGIRRCLDAPPPRETLTAAAAPYGVEAATEAYLDVLLAAAAAGAPRP